MDHLHTVAELLLMRERDSTDRIFCRFEGQTQTFAQLVQSVRAMAGALVQVGAQPGDRIGFMMGSSLEHISLYLASAWVGACAVPFSVHLKSSGLALQLRSSQPALMILSREHADVMHQSLSGLDHVPRLVWLEDGPVDRAFTSVPALLACSKPLASPSPRTLDDAIAISYTSGTTGAPKGVVMSERFYAVGAKNAGLLSEANRDDIYFMWEPFYHVAAWMTVLMALQHGLQIYMVERFSASQLWQQIGQARATKFHYLGGLINIILSQPISSAEVDNTLLIAWGAACPADSWRQFEERFGVRVREGYGISEGQNFTHMNFDGVVGAIGRPAPEFESWIADEAGRPVAAGVTGEIVLRPLLPGVTMTGYFREPEKTAEVLRADGLVYTGDLGMQDVQGQFFFKGRKKDALRRRGENISAWEVERVINQVPGVEESAVVGVAAAVGEQDILALIKPAQGSGVDPMAILNFCDQQLAYYQIPRYVLVVEDFPRGPTQRIRKGEIQFDIAHAFDAEKVGWRPTRSRSREHHDRSQST